MELLIPIEFVKYNIPYWFEDEELTNSWTLIENILMKYGKYKYVEMYFDFNEADTFDNMVYRIKINKICFGNETVTFDIPVYIYVSNNKRRKLTENKNKVVYSTDYETFRNEEGVMIKYFPYWFE